MKKFFALLLICMLLAVGAAEGGELCLVSPLFQTAEYLGTDHFGEGYHETLTYDGGIVTIGLMSFATGEEDAYPAVNGIDFADYMDLRYANVTMIEEIECAPVSGYPTRRLHLEAGSDADECIVDAVAVWTENQTFVMIARTDADAHSGKLEGYAPGETQAMIEDLIATLEIFDPGASAEAVYALTADFSYGNPEPSVKNYEMISAEPFSIGLLGRGLSDLTGLDFLVEGRIEDGAVYVDWQPESTLVAGLDDRVQREDFFFFDVDTLSWFMMDSLYATICQNTGLDTVYFTMNGGEALALPNLSAVREFPADIPYMGSPVYFAHADVQG